MTTKLMLIVNLFFSMAVLLSAIGKTSAVDYTFNNTAQKTPGGIRYDKEVGRDYSLRILKTASAFIWKIFQQQQPSERKNIQRVSLFVDVMDEDNEQYAYTYQGQIHIGDWYIKGYSGDLRTEITGLLYHETTNVWQWNGNGQAPDVLIEGVAEYVRFKAGFSDLVELGQGSSWDQGYGVTAGFLVYCNDLGNGNFVAQLNKKMKDGYSDRFFQELLGKNVDALWSDYKAKYPGN